MKADSNEQLLLKGLACKDKKAIETIYKENFAMVQSFILTNNGSYDDTKDIFQEAMIVLYEKSKDESFVLTCQIKTYIYSVCRRLWLKKLQQYGQFLYKIEGLEDTVSIEEDIELQEKRNTDFAIMEKALSGLGEPCRSLLESYYIHKKGMQEIAVEFGYTNADNAKNQKYKCLMRLKKLFFAQYNIEE